MTATFNHAGFDFQFSDSDVVSPSDFIPAGESNPHNIMPWYIHDHGFCVGIAFASCLQDAFDILADEGRLDRFQISDSDMADYGEEEEGVARLGNAGEPFGIDSLDAFPLRAVPFSFSALFMAASTKPLDEEIEQAAKECARRGYDGGVGSVLPQAFSNEAFRQINRDIPAFMEKVKAYRKQSQQETSAPTLVSVG